MDEISVGPVDCDDIDTCSDSTGSSLTIRLNGFEDLFLRHLARCSVVLVPRLSSRALHIIGKSAIGIGDKTKSKPRGTYATLPPSVLQLDSNLL